MKIISIFAEKLYSFHYDQKEHNELRYLFARWRDPQYLENFYDENISLLSDVTLEEFSRQIILSVSVLEKDLHKLKINGFKDIDSFFVQLHNSEYKEIQLSKRKKRADLLRLYAIKIDNGCYVITGGAIKLTHLMQENVHTSYELSKLNKAKLYLQENGIFDSDSFYEFLSGNYE